MAPIQFMLDIETTGVRAKEDKLLQVAMVEAKFDGKYWLHNGREFNEFCYLHPSYKPTSTFAKEHMGPIYERCYKAPFEAADPFWMREKMLAFMKKSGKQPPFLFMGWNAGYFDVPFLNEKGVLIPPYYVDQDGKDIMLGDNHYRVNDLCGVVGFVMNLTGVTSMEALKAMMAGLDYPKAELPAGKEHDALFDCVSQLNMMNGLLAIMRGREK